MNEQRTPGYYLVRIFSPELHLSFEQPEDDTAPQSEATISWDWFPLSETIFDVVLRTEIPPTGDRGEHVKATAVGRFERVGDSQKPPFKSFVMENASALLAPYLREAVTALTARGLFGPVLLPPINVIEFMQRMKFETSQGYTHLATHPELAAAYGVSVPG